MGTLLRVGHLCGEAVSLLQARPPWGDGQARCKDRLGALHPWRHLARIRISCVTGEDLFIV